MPAPRAHNNVSGVREDREALGLRLRDLRKSANLTGRELSELLSWPASKVSKLENGRQTPSAEDIRNWTRITHTPHEEVELLAALNSLELRHAEWRRLFGSGLRRHQQEIADLNARVQGFRVFESTFVPGLIQTSEYARARLRESAAFFNTHDDLEAAVALRVQRQEILYRPGKTFHFVLTEAVLRYRLCAPETMLGQLDRLISVSALPNVRLGIIKFSTDYRMAPAHGFWLLDDERVMVETFSAELNLAQEPEVALYSNVFKHLAEVASYDQYAREVIKQVIDELVGAPRPPEQ